MNRTLVLVALLNACNRSDAPDYGPPPGNKAPDAASPIDAPLDARLLDALVPKDAPLDAFVPQDAPLGRTCTNKDAVLFNGMETLTVAFRCQSLADAHTAYMTVAGGTGSGAEERVIQFNLDCGTYGIATNQFLTFSATQPLRATKVSESLFDVTCD